MSINVDLDNKDYKVSVASGQFEDLVYVDSCYIQIGDNFNLSLTKETATRLVKELSKHLNNSKP